MSNSEKNAANGHCISVSLALLLTTVSCKSYFKLQPAVRRSHRVPDYKFDNMQHRSIL